MLIPQIFVSLGAFLLFVLLVGLSYESHSEKGKVSNVFAYPDRPKLSLAMFYVTQGRQPIQGIRMLQEMIKESPADTTVIRVLGDFSQRSGQFEKAVMRYESLLAHTSKKDVKQRLNDYAKLEFFYIQLEQYKNALDVLDRMQSEFADQPGLQDAIRKRREEILMNFKI